MSVPPPKIDNRRYDDLVRQTIELAEEYTRNFDPNHPDDCWKRGTKPDAGEALIRIFGRMATLVSDRLNRTPEKNFLAFLDLIGTQIRPPQPARVPLTFQLVTGSPVDAFVPAQTQVAALLPDGEEVVFETEQDLVVTVAQIQAAFAQEPESDRFRDCTAPVTGIESSAFSVFEGDRAIEHSLYFACDQVLTLPGSKAVTVHLRSPEAADLSQFPITWSVWDGSTWKTVLGVVEGLNVTISANQDFIIISKGRAIDANGKQIVLVKEQQISIAKADRDQLEDDRSKTLVLTVSAAPGIFKQEVVFSGHLNTTADAEIVLARFLIDDKGKIQPAFQTTDRSDMDWEFTLSTNLPTPIKQTLYGIEAAWLRASLHAPLPANQIQLPQLLKVQLKVKMEPGNLSPDSCSFNTAAIDTSKDFFPFGEAPRFNDTFYIASNDGFARPGSMVTLTIDLSNPLPVSPSPDLDLKWETWTGQTWQPLSEKFSDTTQKFTIDGTIKFELPQTVAIADVGGESYYWIRARIIHGSYSTEAAQTAMSTSLREATTDKQTLAVHDIRGFLSDDMIRIGGGTGETAQIQTVNVSSTSAQIQTANMSSTGETAQMNTVNVSLKARQIRLKQALSKDYPAGTSVALGFGAPCIGSIQVSYSYESELIPASNCIAQNDFNAVPFSVLSLSAPTDPTKPLTVKLTTTEILAVRDPIYSDRGFSPTWSHLWLQSGSTIETPEIFSVDFQTNTATLVQPLTKSFALDTTFIAVCAVLSVDATQGSLLLKVPYVEGFTAGTSLRITDVNRQNAESIEIEAIDSDQNVLVLRQPLQRNYAKGATLIPIFRPFVPTSDRDPALYLGFDRPFANRPTSLYFQVDPLSPSDQTQPITLPARLSAEYASPTGWSHLGAQDDTQGFRERGLMQFIAPSDLQMRSRFGQTCYWLRVRWEAGEFSILPRLRQVLTNTMWASQTTTLTDEILGSSSGEPNQVYFATQSPVLPGLILEIQEGTLPTSEEQTDLEFTTEQDAQGQITAVWVQWQVVPDFYESNGRDRHYTIDYLTGRIQFGDGQSGKVPVQGRNNIRIGRYQTGGGDRGEFPPQTVNQLKTTVPYVNQVTNLETGGGGAAQESLESVQVRGPKQLRHRGRAVTVQDFEDLAFEASPDIARAKSIAPSFNPLDGNLWFKSSQSLDPNVLKRHESAAKNVGTLRLLIVPYSTARQPTPNLALIERVSDYLRSRAPATLKLEVVPPQWQEVTITTTIVPISLQGADRVRSQVLQRLESFLHPLTGGAKGEGWMFGRSPQESDLYAAIAAVPGVDHVETLNINPNPNTTLDADTLVYSGRHLVHLVGGES